jgi:hypothetical protein
MHRQMSQAHVEQLLRGAVALHQQGRLDEAAAAYGEVISQAPETLTAHSNLGSLLRQVDRIDDAERHLRRAVELAPDHPTPLGNLGHLLRWTGRYAEAAPVFEAALARDPDNRELATNLGAACLGLGRWAEGWRLFAQREATTRAQQKGFGFPMWQGEPLAGRSVFVWQEQGYGDQIQAARFVSVLKSAGAVRVTLAPPRPLVRLFATLDGVDEILPCDPGETVVVPPHDVWTLPFALPQHLGVTLQTLPDQPYLAAPEAARTRWAGFPEGEVGFVWHGNPAQPVERYRGLPSPQLLEPLRGLARLVDLQAPRGDFADTAAIVEQLDLVITTDTAMAHLAGALGAPCWLMLPALGADWRWALEPSRSPWYPSMRIFRQRAAGDWTDVVEAMRQALASDGRRSAEAVRRP